MSEHDSLWISFPRWLEESGLPERMASAAGVEAWVLFRKLVEIDCDVNLTPHWFAFSQSDLSRWTGLSEERVELLLERMEAEEWIERPDGQTCRIKTPLKVPIEEAVIRNKLPGGKAKGGYLVLRYAQDIRAMNAVEKVVYLYQMLFGARFSPRIAEDLEEIANSYDMSVIHDAFAEAHSRKVKSLAWVKSHLGKSMEKQPDAKKRITPNS